jgi:hypothetical protein
VAFHPVHEQGLFGVQTSLLYNSNKPCLRVKEALFENQAMHIVGGAERRAAPTQAEFEFLSSEF